MALLILVLDVAAAPRTLVIRGHLSEQLSDLQCHFSHSTPAFVERVSFSFPHPLTFPLNRVEPLGPMMFDDSIHFYLYVSGPIPDALFLAKRLSSISFQGVRASFGYRVAK